MSIPIYCAINNAADINITRFLKDPWTHNHTCMHPRKKWSYLCNVNNNMGIWGWKYSMTIKLVVSKLCYFVTFSDRNVNKIQNKRENVKVSCVDKRVQRKTHLILTWNLTGVKILSTPNWLNLKLQIQKCF
jgi:hypothetical protein